MINLQHFLSMHQLPSSYGTTAKRWFDPLADSIVSQSKTSNKPFIIGVSGCQGSGKTTLGSYLAHYLISCHQKKVVSLSIDDFYLNQTDRSLLAKHIHPLLKTRGVPGTHNISLALDTLTNLQNGTSTLLPRFNKATDNPYPVNQWETIQDTIDVIILEGWCVGVTPQDEEALIEPINDLEAKQDANGIWRTYVNEQLAGDYQTLFDLIDYKVFLKAPTFDCVLNWRMEQEQKLAAATNHSKNHNHAHESTADNFIDSAQAIMTDNQISTFISHYQRLTEHALQTLPYQSDTVFYLNKSRAIIEQKHIAHKSNK